MALDGSMHECRYHVHLVGDTASSCALPIDVPSLFAHIVYRTPGWGDCLDVSTSCLDETAGDEGCDTARTLDDPTLNAIVAACTNTAFHGALDSNVAAAVAAIVPHDHFRTQFAQVPISWRHVPSSEINLKVAFVVCTTVRAYDHVVQEAIREEATLASSVHEDIYPANEELMTVVTTIVGDHSPSRLLLLYAQWLQLLVQTRTDCAKCGGKWLHLLDSVLEKFQSLRSCAVLVTVV